MENKNKPIRPWRDDELTGWWFMNVGDATKGPNKCDERSWEDCQKYNFMIAGGERNFVDSIKMLKNEHRLLAYANGVGFVGAGIVKSEAVKQAEFRTLDGTLLFDPTKSFKEMKEYLKTPPKFERLHNTDENKCDWCVRVDWKSPERNRSKGVLGKVSDCDTFNRRGTVHRLDNVKVVRAALEALGVDPDTLNGPLRETARPEPECQAPPPFSLAIDPGDADTETIREVLSALSDLHEAHTGYALIYSVDGSLVLALAEVCP